MRKADLGAVDCAITDGLEENEDIVISWIEDDLLSERLRIIILATAFTCE